MQLIGHREIQSVAWMICMLLLAAGAGRAETPNWTVSLPQLPAGEHVIATAINPAPDKVPTMLCRLYRRDVAFVTVLFPSVPGFRLDACTYEPSGGFLALEFEGVELPSDNRMVLRHRLTQYPQILHLSELTATEGAVELVERLKLDPDYHGPAPALPDDLPVPNLCWGFGQSPALVGGGNPATGESHANYPLWIARCFILTKRGWTTLDHTERVKTNEVPPDDPRNNPVYSEHYIGVWQEYPRDIPNVNTSPDRYIFPLIGATTNDGKHLVGLACATSRYIAQAWHTCMHQISRWSPPEASLLDRTIRMKFYVMPNQPLAFLQRVSRDFPGRFDPAAAALPGSAAPAAP